MTIYSHVKVEIPATYKQATMTIPVLRTPIYPRIPCGVRILFSNGNIIPIPSKVNIAKKVIEIKELRFRRTIFVLDRKRIGRILL